ncbi:MAG: DedA family protein [Actinomycetota bacterium]|nr:DedA family protein [Actinomycetota bacterium]
MEHFIQRFAEHGYLAVFILMTLESACIPIPSEVTMLFAGYLASSAAHAGPDLNLVAVILLGTFGNLVGSWLAFGAGRLIGRGPLDRYGKYVLIRSHDIDKAEVWWSRHGQGAVFFGRLLPVIRTFISLPAGIAEMSFPRFSVYTFAGSLPWVAALGIAGYELGSNWNKVTGSFNIASIVIAIVLVGVAAVFLVRRRRARVEGA